MPDAPITLAEMIAEAKSAADMAKWMLSCTAGDQGRAPLLRRISVMEEIVRYLQREAEAE